MCRMSYVRNSSGSPAARSAGRTTLAQSIAVTRSARRLYDQRVATAHRSPTSEVGGQLLA